MVLARFRLVCWVLGGRLVPQHHVTGIEIHPRGSCLLSAAAMPRLHVIVQRYVPRWVIEIALVAAAVQIYRQTLDLRSRFLNQPIMVRLSPESELRSGH